MCNGTRRNPVASGTNKGSVKGDLIPLRGLVEAGTPSETRLMQLDTRNLTETGSFPQPSAASPGLTDCYQVDIQGVRYKSVNVGEEKNRVSPNRSFGDRFTKKPKHN